MRRDYDVYFIGGWGGGGGGGGGGGYIFCFWLFVRIILTTAGLGVD